MKYNIENELKKIELLTAYANQLVRTKAIKEQTRLNQQERLSFIPFSGLILYVSGLYPVFKGNSEVHFKTRDELYKRTGRVVHYVTLLEPIYVEDDGSTDPYCEVYTSKGDIDDCPSLVELKILARSMIANPSNHFRITN